MAKKEWDAMVNMLGKIDHIMLKFPMKKGVNEGRNNDAIRLSNKTTNEIVTMNSVTNSLVVC